MSEIETTAFCLHLRPGAEAEYEKRHDALWPEMKAMLAEHGVLHYEIWLHRETMNLHGFIVRRKDHTMAAIPDHPVQARWRAHMADLLVQGPDGMPVREEMARMFRFTAPGFRLGG